jgi:hypothetical protein
MLGGAPSAATSTAGATGTGSGGAGTESGSGITSATTTTGSGSGGGGGSGAGGGATSTGAGGGASTAGGGATNVGGAGGGASGAGRRRRVTVCDAAAAAAPLVGAGAGSGSRAAPRRRTTLRAELEPSDDDTSDPAVPEALPRPRLRASARSKMLSLAIPAAAILLAPEPVRRGFARLVSPRTPPRDGAGFPVPKHRRPDRLPEPCLDPPGKCPPGEARDYRSARPRFNCNRSDLTKGPSPRARTERGPSLPRAAPICSALSTDRSRSTS